MEGGKILMRWKFRGMRGEAGEEDVEEKEVGITGRGNENNLGNQRILR
jgi:hypothetical protein